MSSEGSSAPKNTDGAGRRQHQEYRYPYHHLPNDDFGHLRLGRVFRGGAEYLAYNAQVIDAVRAARPAAVLDVGCGDGRLLMELRRTLDGDPPELLGVDLDARAIHLARAFAPEIRFEVRSVHELERTFDVVTCVETLEHVEDELEMEFLDATLDRVRPGGVLVLTVPSTARPVLDKHHRHYTVETLRDRIAASRHDTRIVRLEEIVPRRPWLDQALRLISNKQYSVDVGLLNDVIVRLHQRHVRPGGRGLHVVAVLERR